MGNAEVGSRVSAAVESRPIRLVIVEDHVALRQGVELLLGRWGHVITGAAADAAHGYELVRSVRPDVAIVDLGLPGESGAELTRRIVADDPNAAVLLYTGIEEQEKVNQALECGARGFALKAGPPQELIGAIRVLSQGGSYMDPRLSSLMLARATTEGVGELSPREREVLDLLAHGMTGAQAAKRLFLSPETVRTHVRNAMTKLEARTRVHAVALALRQREISLGTALTAADGG
jgi:DNA-binding NarL/FixJ family response regulator